MFSIFNLIFFSSLWLLSLAVQFFIAIKYIDCVVILLRFFSLLAADNELSFTWIMFFYFFLNMDVYSVQVHCFSAIEKIVLARSNVLVQRVYPFSAFCFFFCWFCILPNQIVLCVRFIQNRSKSGIFPSSFF